LIDHLIPFLEEMVRFGVTWGPLLVFLFMTVESSFIPFPSEIVMIPAGFMAARGEFYPQDQVWPAICIAILCGIAGSLIGSLDQLLLIAEIGASVSAPLGKIRFPYAGEAGTGRGAFPRVWRRHHLRLPAHPGGAPAHFHPCRDFTDEPGALFHFYRCRGRPLGRDPHRAGILAGSDHRRPQLR
jgi:hypothetical protein